MKKWNVIMSVSLSHLEKEDYISKTSIILPNGTFVRNAVIFEQTRLSTMYTYVELGNWIISVSLSN